jgi:hypothetical protein
MNLNTQKVDRLSLWSVVAIGFFVIVFGVFQLRSQLFSHDRVAASIREKLYTLAAQDADSYLSKNSEGENLASLQDKDTDEDGMSDFEELYVHATSPYLADSDSDTVIDSEELAAGTNPNCPEGQACTIQGGSAATGGTSAESAFADLNPAQLGIDTSTGEVDPEELRKKLAEYGVPQDVLEGTDDATLLKLFNETLAGGVNAGGTDPIQVIQTQAETIRNMTLDEKRELLAQSGLDAQTIEGLDEETINQLFDQATTQAVEEVTEQDTTNTNSANTNDSTNSSSDQTQ